MKIFLDGPAIFCIREFIYPSSSPMIPSSIISLARTLTHTDSAQIPDATALTFLNIIYDDLTSAIAREVNQDYFFHTWYADLIAGSNTYSLPARDSTHVGLLALIGISVRYDSRADYTPLRQMRPGSVQGDLDTYRRLQPACDPFFVVADPYVMIYPDPQESVIAGLKIYGIRRADPLALDSTEGSIMVPSEYHHIFALGIRRYILSSRGQEDEALLAERSYTAEKQKMLTQLAERDLASTTSVMPDISFLS